MSPSAIKAFVRSATLRSATRRAVRSTPRVAVVGIAIGASALLMAATREGEVGAPESIFTVQAQAQTPQDFDLSTLFGLGGLIKDTNGDSIPDALNGVLLLGSAPSLTERMAAAEIAARLGFETTALTLPLPTALADGDIGIILGNDAYASTELESGGAFLPSPSPGEATIEAHFVDGRGWIVVRGGTDNDLLKAARHLSGALPHTETLSSPSFTSIADDLEGILAEGQRRVGSEATPSVTFHALVLRSDGPVSLHGNVSFSEDESANDPTAMDALVGSPDTLTYEGIDEILLTNGNETLTLAVTADPDPPGPIPGRPGNGAKGGLDLSNLYTPDGLLGDSDSDLIPDRVDAQLLPSENGSDALPDLAARLGLESTGLTVPLTRTAEETESPDEAPTLILTGLDNPLTQSLIDSGVVALDDLGPGDGLIRIVPDAHGKKSALVVTGTDPTGANRALTSLAETFPHLSARGKDRPTIDDVERELWDALSARSPAGQAAIGLYKLDQLLDRIDPAKANGLEVLLSLEKPDPRLESVVRQAVADRGMAVEKLTIDDRDVQNARVIFDDAFEVPSEVTRLREVFRREVLPSISDGENVAVRARISESPEVRRRIAEELREELVASGAGTESSVQVLSAFKQAYSWLDEAIKPRVDQLDADSMVLRFRRNDPPENWPQQAMNTPARWLHEAFPFDEIFARDTKLTVPQIRLEMTDKGPTYEAVLFGKDGERIHVEMFEPHFVLRPYFDRFEDYEHVRVTTGWIHAEVGERVLVDQRIVTDPEWFWDRFQAETLPAIYDYVMDRHRGKPRGDGSDAPFFGELTVDLELSEPHRALGIDKEFISPLDAIHEEVYFSTIEFFQLLGRNSRGQDLTYPGRILPIMRPADHGSDGHGRITLTGFATHRPAVVVTWTDKEGRRHEDRLDIPKVSMERPSARRAVVSSREPGIEHLALRVKVDTDADVRDSLLQQATPEQVDGRMISAEQVVATVELLAELRSRGLYTSALSPPGLGAVTVWAEWSHEEDPKNRRTATLPANGSPRPLPSWADLGGNQGPSSDRIVHWEEPIPPSEGHAMLATMAARHPDAVYLYKAGQSYLGKDIWAADLMPQPPGTHWSQAKLTTMKPTIIYSARQHANEVSSTSHVLRHAELLLTDPEQRKKLDKVNVVIHPFTNPDGAQ